MYPFTLLCSSANHTLQSPKMVALSFHLSLCLFCCSLSMMLLHAQTRELVERAQFSCFHLASSPSFSPHLHPLTHFAETRISHALGIIISVFGQLLSLYYHCPVCMSAAVLPFSVCLSLSPSLSISFYCRSPLACRTFLSLVLFSL